MALASHSIRSPSTQPKGHPGLLAPSTRRGHCLAPLSKSTLRSKHRSVCEASLQDAPWKKKNVRLVLEDGSVWKGAGFGAGGTRIGEVVFNTSMTGYQEIMTDPSYKDQFVCFTHPHIGNVGVNKGEQVPTHKTSSFSQFVVYTRSKLILIYENSNVKQPPKNMLFWICR